MSGDVSVRVLRIQGRNLTPHLEHCLQIQDSSCFYTKKGVSKMLQESFFSARKFPDWLSSKSYSFFTFIRTIILLYIAGKHPGGSSRKGGCASSAGSTENRFIPCEFNGELRTKIYNILPKYFPQCFPQKSFLKVMQQLIIK